MSSPPESASDSAAPASRTAARIGLFAGPLLAAAVFLVIHFSTSGPTPPAKPELSAEEAAHQAALLKARAQAVAAVGVLMAVWWMTEAIPLEATSLLPLVLFPLLGATPDLKTAAAPYADEAIFLYLGGFLLALAVEKWGLHRRLALLTLLAVGTRPNMLVGGFMLATALISLWISNTATTLMMLPIGLSVIHLLTDKLASASQDSQGNSDAANFATAVLLGIAYAASIGGFGTLIGTPPNTYFKGFMKDHGIEVGFGRWMLFALPICGAYLLLAWLTMTRLFPIRSREIPGGRELIRQELTQLGQMSRGEWIVLVVFLAAATLWISREWLVGRRWLTDSVPTVASISDAVIAMSAAIALFVIPVDWSRGRFALDWKTAGRVPWGILLLFGGGLSLAKAMTDSRLDQWIGAQVTALAQLPLSVVIVVVVIGVVLFSELASNLATATALLPIVFGVAQQLQLDPMTLCVPVILAASCGFMLPVATPPNAIVFGTGYIGMRQMMRAGFWLDLIGIVLIPLGTLTLGRLVMGIGR